MRPTPLEDLVRYFDSTGLALTEPNVREMAKMLSLTDMELMLALLMVKRQPRLNEVVEGPVPVTYFYRGDRAPKRVLYRYIEFHGW